MTIDIAGVFLGVTVYTYQDIHFTVIGYVWIAIWYCFAVFEMVYVKKVVDTVQMTTWSRTYYQVRPKSRLLLCSPHIQPGLPTITRLLHALPCRDQHHTAAQL